MPVAICFFLSGAAALILQVLWTRMLGHVFGATALAISTTLTVFMGGLALGSHFGGRYAPKLKHPLVAFAVLESAVGLYGLFVPSLLELMPTVQRAAGLQLGFWAYAIFRFSMVAVVLILPTTAMGATLPILAEGIVDRSDNMASKVGRLYAANTFGAVVGACGAGFFLIPRFGIASTVFLAAGIDLFVAAVVLGLWKLGGRRLLARETRTESADDVLARLEPEPVMLVPARDQKLALVVFAMSGAAAMALEVLWSRSVGVVIGASTYSFTLILTTFLVGLAGGAALASRWVDRLRDPMRALAQVQVAVGCFAITGTLLVDHLPFILHDAARAGDVTTTGLYFTSVWITALVTLPATLALGAVMPLVVRILVGRPSDDDGTHAGPIVGRAYALNTVGAIVGSFAGGFLILPLLGVERGLQISAATSLCLGVLIIVLRTPPPIREDAPPPPSGRGVLVFALAGALLMTFSPRWDVRAWTAGLFRMYLARDVYLRGWTPSGEVVFHRDGVATTVTVERQTNGGAISLKVNGKVDASDVGDMPTQVLSGLLPVLLHEGPKEVLVIGYGSGVTPGAVLKAPVDHVRVAEIESAVYDASNTHMAHVNHRPWEDPRAELVVDDGRNFLLTRKDTYDIIISEPSNPWMSGAASLFTEDFFRIAKGRLRPGGIFLQWLQLYELAPANIHVLIRTFHSVFPYVLVFTPSSTSNDTFLVGSFEPVTMDRARAQVLFDDPNTREELKRALVEQPEDFVGLFLMGTEEIDGFVGEGPLNTDDNALIEFAAPRDLLLYSTRDARIPFRDAVEGRRREKVDLYFSGFELDGPGLETIAHRLLLQGRIKDARAFADDAAEQGQDVDRIRRLADLVDEPDRLPVVIADEHTTGDPVYAQAVLHMTKNNERDALAVLEREKDLEERSLAHRFLYAFLCYRQERLDDAEYLMKNVVADDAFTALHPETLYYAGRFSMYAGDYRVGMERLGRYDAAVLAEALDPQP